MLARERRGMVLTSASFRKDPLLEPSPLAKMEESMSAGSASDKIGAMLRLSRVLEQDAVPKERSSGILRRGLEDAEREVRWNAVVILARHVTQFLPELCRGMSNEDGQVRVVSTAAVKGMKLDQVSSGSDMRAAVDILIVQQRSADRLVAENSTEVLRAIARLDPLAVLDRKERMPPEVESAALEALHQRGMPPC